jgi:membrane protein DedA with SNARE-associated domain
MLQDLLGHFTYLALFGLLVAGGLGVPVPEELVQLTAGYLARRGILSLLPAAAVAWAGILAGDYLLFRLGRSQGPRVLDSRHVARVLTPARRAFIERHFGRHSILTIAVARHASGLRLAVFALAGASGVRSWTFLLADGLSALASVPLVVGAGWYFAGHVEELKRRVHWAEAALALAVAAGVTVWVLLARRRERSAAGKG